MHINLYVRLFVILKFTLEYIFFETEKETKNCQNFKNFVIYINDF